MTCEAARDELALLALGEASERASEAVAHLAACSQCQSAYRDYLSAVEHLVAALPRAEPPPHLRDAVLRSVREEKLAGAAPPRRGRAAARRSWLWRLFERGEAWGAAALVLAAVSGLLWWNSLALSRRLEELQGQQALLRAELLETWRAFAGAPAVYAGLIVFDGDRGAGTGASGYLYQRPNGWAVIIQVRGLGPDARSNYAVWLREPDGWVQAGPLLVDEEGVGLFIYYAREPEVAVERVRIVKAGVLPGTPQWAEAAIAEGRVVADAPASGREGAGPAGASGGPAGARW